jgi:hypothetical protein
MPDEASSTATNLIRTGFGLLTRPPFVWLVAVGLLGVLATEPIHSEDVASFVGIALVTVISAYVSIAITLAAADREPSRSPEFWVRAALARRCLVRSFVTLLFATVLVAAGLIALVVPGFIVGSFVALSEIAAVLENHHPGDAVRRSIELSRPARRPIGIVYGLLVIVPGGALQVALTLGTIDPGWLRGAAGCLTLLLASAAQIALTKAYLELGGEKLRREEPARAPDRS